MVIVVPSTIGYESTSAMDAPALKGSGSNKYTAHIMPNKRPNTRPLVILFPGSPSCTRTNTIAKSP